MKKLVAIFFLFIHGFCSGQNLVPNGDFETYINCPIGLGTACSPFIDILDSATGNWHNIGCASADYYNVCNNSINSQVGVPVGIGASTYQFSRSGSGHIGMVEMVMSTGLYCEYPGTYLTTPLVAGIEYYVEFYTNRDGHYGPDSADVMGALFTVGEPDTTGFWSHALLPYTAQINNPDGNFISDTLNWTKVSGTFIASGGENFITLGNFKDTSSVHGWGYYFVDDVSVTSTVAVNELNQSTLISVFPIPFDNQININTNNNELFEITVFDINSKMVLHQMFSHTTTLSTVQLDKGMYFYEVKNINGIIKSGKAIK